MPSCYFCDRPLRKTHRYRLPKAAVTKPMGYRGPLPDDARMCGICYDHFRDGRLPPKLRQRRQLARSSRTRLQQPHRHAQPADTDDEEDEQGEEQEEEQEEEEEEEDEEEQEAKAANGDGDKMHCAVCSISVHRIYRYHMPTPQKLASLGYYGPALPDGRMCSVCYKAIRRNRLPLALQPDASRAAIQRAAQAVDNKRNSHAHTVYKRELLRASRVLPTHCGLCRTLFKKKAHNRKRPYFRIPVDQLTALGYTAAALDTITSTSRMCHSCHDDITSRIEEQSGVVVDEAAAADAAACAVCDKVWDGSAKRYNAPTSGDVLRRLGYEGWAGVRPRPQRSRMCRVCWMDIHDEKLPRGLRMGRVAVAVESKSGRVEEEEEEEEKDETSAAQDKQGKGEKQQDGSADDETQSDDGLANHSDDDDSQDGNDDTDSDARGGYSHSQHDSEMMDDDDNNNPTTPVELALVPLPFPDRDQHYITLPLPATLLTFNAVKRAAQRICSQRRGKLSQLKRSLLEATVRMSATVTEQCSLAELSECVSETFGSLQQCWQHWLPKDEWVKRWNELLHLWLALVWLYHLDKARHIRAEMEEAMDSEQVSIVLKTVRLGVLKEAYLAVSKCRRELNEQLAVAAAVLRHTSLRNHYLLSVPYFRIHAIAGSSAFEPFGHSLQRNVRLIDRTMGWIYSQRQGAGKHTVSMKAVRRWLDENDAAEDDDAEVEKEGEQAEETVQEENVASAVDSKHEDGETGNDGKEVEDDVVLVVTDSDEEDDDAGSNNSTQHWNGQHDVNEMEADEDVPAAPLNKNARKLLRQHFKGNPTTLSSILAEVPVVMPVQDEEEEKCEEEDGMVGGREQGIALHGAELGYSAAARLATPAIFSPSSTTSSLSLSSSSSSPSSEITSQHPYSPSSSSGSTSNSTMTQPTSVIKKKRVRAAVRRKSASRPTLCPVTDCSSQHPTEIAMYAHLVERHQQHRCPNLNCQLVCSDAESLKQHLTDAHSRGLPYVCEFCGTGFTLSCNRKVHMRLHTGDEPFVCAVVGCERQFNVRQHLDVHALTHSLGERERSFQCDLCDKAYYKTSALNQHKRVKHTPTAVDNSRQGVAIP